MGNTWYYSVQNSTSEYFNYKNTFSIVLLTLIDANYNIVNVVCQERVSDSGGF